VPPRQHFDAADLDAAFQAFNDDLVTSEGAGGYRRVRRPDTADGIANSTVSEGIAYGMLIAVAMNDQPLFDDLWRYSQLWLDHHGLMQWEIDPEGTTACPGDPGSSCGAATDSDQDMASALLLADATWGGQGALPESYRSYAPRQIDTIFEWEIERFDNYAVKPGDTWGGYAQTNPSCFAPAYDRVFGEVTLLSLLMMGGRLLPP
jgi:endo-1,4-beta-D-glucanase Y